jgi:hypothetical protein
MSKWMRVLGLVVLMSCVACETTKTTPPEPEPEQWSAAPNRSLSVWPLDLGKTWEDLLSENPGASLNDRGAGAAILQHQGGVSGSGDYFEYSWHFRDGVCYRISYLTEYDEQTYQEWLANGTELYGASIDLTNVSLRGGITGGGFKWNIPDSNNILLITNGANKLILVSLGSAYALGLDPTPDTPN